MVVWMVTSGGVDAIHDVPASIIHRVKRVCKKSLKLHGRQKRSYMGDACKGKLERPSCVPHERERPPLPLSLSDGARLHSMLPTTWSWDMGSTSSSVNDYCPYPDEISKKIEICYLTMGPERFECDVGGGRVVTKTRKGLVQHIKGEPGRWRAVKREVHGPGATHSPAPPPSLAPAAPAAPAQHQQLKRFHPSAVTSGRMHHASFGQDELSDDDFAVNKASIAFMHKRRAVLEQAPASSHSPAATSASLQEQLQENLEPSHGGRARPDPTGPSGRSPLSPAKPQNHIAMPAVAATSAAADDDDTSDEDEDEDEDEEVEMEDEATSERYVVCNDKLWEFMSAADGLAAGLTRVELAGTHASFFTEENVEAVSLFDNIGTNLFVEFAADQGARLLNTGFAQTPSECPHAKVEDDMPTRLYFESSASQAAYEPAFKAVNEAAQEAGFLRHKPFAVTAMACGSSHKIHVDPRALYGLTSLQQKKVKEPVQAVLSAERFAEPNEIILQTSGATVFGFGVIDRCKLNTKSAQHKQKIGLQGFQHAVVMIIRVPGDTLAFSSRLAAGGCAALSVEGGVCRFVEARGNEPTLVAHAAEPLASCCALPTAVRTSLLAAMPDAKRDSILLMARFNGQVAHAKEMVRKLHAALADAKLAPTVAVPAAPFDRAHTPWQAAALSAMLHAPTEENVLRCLSGGALKHLGLSFEHVLANNERMRSTQHGEAIKVGHANSAATNPAAQVLMAADDSLTASGAVTKVGHANSAATDPAAQVLMAADASLTASSAVTKVGFDKIRRAIEEEWAKRQRQDAALGPAFAASSVAMHLFR